MVVGSTAGALVDVTAVVLVVAWLGVAAAQVEATPVSANNSNVAAPANSAARGR